MSNKSEETNLVDDYLEINENVIKLLIFALGTVHILAFFCFLYTAFCKFFFVPFSSHKDTLYYIGLSIHEMSLSNYLIYALLSVIGYLLVFGFISLMVGIYHKIKLVNENMIAIAFDTNVNLKASLVVGDKDRRVSRRRNDT